MHATVPVETASARYSVTIGPGILRTLGETLNRVAPRARRIHAVVDSGVPASLVHPACDSVRAAGYELDALTITPSERAKSAESWFLIHRAVSDFGLDRGDAIVAIGGGIVGDLAGFAAATYMRGIGVVQCPTTLLAMVDASVGGKTGINLPAREGLLKNAVGAFHQPLAVVADTESLGSLSPRDYRSGLAECIKHAMLSADFGDPELHAWMSKHEGQILAQEPGALTELVRRNVAVKAKVVAGDERETAPGDAGRALLNLGHTFAHAIETLDGIRVEGSDPAYAITHGEAVALGLIAASALSEYLGHTSDLADRVRGQLAALGLPTSAAGLPEADELLSRMARDKKAEAGKLRFVVPVGEGRCRVVRDVPEEAVRGALDAIRAG